MSRVHSLNGSTRITTILFPEWDNVEPKVNHNILLDRFNYAKSLNVNAHPVIVGPITFVKLSKGGHQSFEEKVQTLLPLYKEVLQSLIDAVQLISKLMNQY